MSIHLPYKIDDENRDHHYETLWKEISFSQLQRHEDAVNSLSLLDFGCGRGESMEIAKKLGMRVAGTDVDEECVRLSSKYGETSLLNTNDPLAQFGEDSFDVVSCFHVLEHVPCPLETLSLISKIARKYVLFAVPNLSRFNDLLRPNRWVKPINEGHLQSWDHSHFKNLAEKHCDLQILEWEHDAVIIPPISNFVLKWMGEKAAMKLEKGIFRKMHPFASISVMGIATPNKIDLIQTIKK